MPSVVSEHRKPKREGRVLALVLPIKSQMNLSFPIRQTKGLMIPTPGVRVQGAGAKGGHLLSRATPRGEGGTETYFLDRSL